MKAGPEACADGRQKQPATGPQGSSKLLGKRLIAPASFAILAIAKLLSAACVG